MSIDSLVEEINRYCFESVIKEVLGRDWEQHKKTSNYIVDTVKIKQILEKHLKQSEKVQYDMGYKDGHRDTLENIVDYGFKQSEKVVEISKKELKKHCIGDEYGIVYGAVCLLLLSKGIKMID